MLTFQPEEARLKYNAGGPFVNNGLINVGLYDNFQGVWDSSGKSETVGEGVMDA